MNVLRTFAGLTLCLVILAATACAPRDPRSRIDAALVVLQSDASGARKAEACSAIRAAFAELPRDTAGWESLAERTARLVVTVLADPLARAEARETLVSLGLPAHKPLFDAVLEATPDAQEAAVTCLIQMSNTAVPLLVPVLVGQDSAAQDRAARILIRLGKPVSAVLRRAYADLLQPFAGADVAAASRLSTQGKEGIRTLARVFGEIGDKTSVLALLDGCEALHRSHPDLAAEHLRIIEALGPVAIDSLNGADRLGYERLRLTVGDTAATQAVGVVR